jgi:hypothetical protein
VFDLFHYVQACSVTIARNVQPHLSLSLKASTSSAQNRVRNLWTKKYVNRKWLRYPVPFLIWNKDTAIQKYAFGTETSSRHDIAALPDVQVSYWALWDKNCKKAPCVSFRNTTHRAGGPISELPYIKVIELPHAAECAGKRIFFLVLTYVRECWPLATQDEIFSENLK